MKRYLFVVFAAIVACVFSPVSFADKLTGTEYDTSRNVQTPARSGKISPQEVARRNATVCKDGRRCTLEAAAAEDRDTQTRQASNNAACAGLSGNALKMCNNASSAIPALGGLLGR